MIQKYVYCGHKCILRYTNYNRPVLMSYSSEGVSLSDAKLLKNLEVCNKNNEKSIITPTTRFEDIVYERNRIIFVDDNGDVYFYNSTNLFL